MNLIKWIRAELRPRQVDSTALLYDRMESQSGRCLPVIYQPFDINKRSHWADRGACWDFYHSVGDGRLLDFGPGDGWPALLLAPFVEEVIGVDASARRVKVCRENAKRLNIRNAEFIQVPAGESLPFADELFDGVTAASAVEQTPDPQATIAELYRVLRPGGKLRITYEALGRYRDGRERELDLWPLGDSKTLLLVYDRNLKEERVVQYALLLEANRIEIESVLRAQFPLYGVMAFELGQLDLLRSMVTDSCQSVLRHPSGATLQQWLLAAGFSSVEPTQNGSDFGACLYDEIVIERRPQTLVELDSVLRSEVTAVVLRPAPIESDPWLTAVK
ncbi:MAG: class I SAM-dependent methyltransferase [bacterium]